MFGQGTGPFSWDIEVTAPDGTTILGFSTATNEYLVQDSCDGVLATAYPPLGHET